MALRHSPLFGALISRDYRSKLFPPALNCSRSETGSLVRLKVKLYQSNGCQCCSKYTVVTRAESGYR